MAEKPKKKLWMRIVVLVIACLMVGGAIALPFFKMM